MYVPAQFDETDVPTLHRLVQDHSLGMLVTHHAGELDAHHLPFFLDTAAGPQGRLLAHVARANPLWRQAVNGERVLVVFRGAQGYVSPNWYPSKAQTHRSVPTWNYEVVHAHGSLHVHDDEAFVRAVVARLTRQHEASQPQPWKMSDAPADFLTQELGQIVGIEVRITHWVGKRKLSQHHAPADRAGAIEGLRGCGHSALAQAMQSTPAVDISPNRPA